MESFIKPYLCASMIYLLAGSFLGMFMAFKRGRFMSATPAHAHINLVGWVSNMVFFLSYAFVVKASGKPLYSESLATIQFWAGNLGLIGMAVSMYVYRAWKNRLALAKQPAPENAIQQSSVWLCGALVMASFFLFFLNMVKTLNG